MGDLMERAQEVARITGERQAAAAAWAEKRGLPALCPRDPERCRGQVDVALRDIGMESEHGDWPVVTQTTSTACPFEGEGRCPHWQARQRAQMLRHLANLGFSREAQEPSWERVPAEFREPAQLYCRTLGERLKAGQGLTLGADTGAGKTCVLALIAWAARAVGTHYTTAHRLYRTLDRSWEQGEALDMLRHCPLLLLDDLGAEVPTPRAAAEFHDLLDWRTGEHLATCVTTNLFREQLEADPRLQRIFSRLSVRNAWLESTAETQRVPLDWRTAWGAE